MSTPDSNSKPARGAGRFTPKGSAASGNSKSTGPVAKKGDKAEKEPGYASSGRYTPPVERNTAEMAAMSVTKVWVPWLMGLLMAVGGLLIVLNYVGVWPHAPSNWYLLGGIVAITGGFVTATQLK